MKKLLQPFVIIINILTVTNVIAAVRPASFMTIDGVEISASVDGDTVEKGLRPAVIFIHQGGSSKEEWSKLPLFERVAGAGMVALAFDVRGHGASTGSADLGTLFDSPDEAPRDLEAALEWLIDTGQVDPQRIAVVGASIGANLAVVAAGSERFNIKTAVAISAKTSAAFNLAGGAENVSTLKSLFLIASELEQEGMRARWASELFDLAGEPRELVIVAGSSGHGVSILQDDTGLADRIFDWLLETL